MSKKQLFFATAVLGLIFFALIASLWFFPRSAFRQAVEDFEDRVGRLDIASYAPEPLPENQNASHWLMLGSPPQYQPSAPIETYAENFALLTRAEALPSDLQIDYERGFEAPLPDLGRLLQGMKVLDAFFQDALARKDSETAVLALQTLASLRGAFFREPIIVTQILGLAVDEKYLEALKSLLEKNLLDEASRSVALRELNLEVREQQFAAAIAGEASVILSAPVDKQSTAQRFFAKTEAATLLEFFARLPEAARLPPHETEAFLAQDLSFLTGFVAEIGWITMMTTPSLKDLARKEAIARQKREQIRRLLRENAGT